MQTTQKKIQNIVRPTRSPPRRTKNVDLSIVFQSGRAKDLSAPLYIHWPLVSFWPVKNLAEVTYVPTVYVRCQGIRFCFVRHPAIAIAVQSDSLLIFQLQVSPAKTSKCPIQLQYLARMADRVSC